MTSLGNFVEIFLQTLMAGILVGAVYGLMCVGLGIIFGVMRVINFAQGEVRAARFQFGASIRSSSGMR